MRSASTLRRLSLLAWLASMVLIVLAGVLLIVGGGESVAPGQVDLEVQREARGRTVNLGTVGLVAVLGALTFALGAWARLRAEEVERRAASAGFGVRPRRDGHPRSRGQGMIMPPAGGEHDDLNSPDPTPPPSPGRPFPDPGSGPQSGPDVDPDADPEKP